MSKKYDKQNKIRIFPKTKKALDLLMPKLKVPSTLPKLANQCIIEGAKVLSK